MVKEKNNNSDMKINREKVKVLMNKYCEGNCHRFARELGVQPAHLHRFLNTSVGGGKKIVFGIIKFCREKRLDFNDYIED